MKPCLINIDGSWVDVTEHVRSALVDPRTAAALREHARIVEYLRRNDHWMAADAIERGDHRSTEPS